MDVIPNDQIYIIFLFDKISLAFFSILTFAIRTDVFN